MWAWLLALAVAAPCGGDVDDVVKALDTVDPSLRVSLASAGLAEICQGQPSLAGAARSVTESPPDFHAVLDLKAIAENPVLWMAVCDGGLAVAQRMAQVTPEQKRLVVWKDCGLADRGWFTDREWLGADGLIGLSLVGGQALEEAGIDEDAVRTITRGLAGVGAPGGATNAYGIPTLAPAEVFEEYEGREPPPGIDDPESGRVLTDLLGTSGSGLVLTDVPMDRPPAFVERPEVKWNRAAKRSERRVCKVEVTVWKAGVFGKVDWVKCPEALREPVQKALEAAQYEPAIENGQPVKGSFQTRFAVKP